MRGDTINVRQANVTAKTHFSSSISNALIVRVQDSLEQPVEIGNCRERARTARRLNRLHPFVRGTCHGEKKRLIRLAEERRIGAQPSEIRDRRHQLRFCLRDHVKLQLREFPREPDTCIAQIRGNRHLGSGEEIVRVRAMDRIEWREGRVGVGEIAPEIRWSSAVAGNRQSDQKRDQQEASCPRHGTRIRSSALPRPQTEEQSVRQVARHADRKGFAIQQHTKSRTSGRFVRLTVRQETCSPFVRKLFHR